MKSTEHKAGCFSLFTGTFAVAVTAAWGLCQLLFCPHLSLRQPLPISIFLPVKDAGPISLGSETVLLLRGWSPGCPPRAGGSSPTEVTQGDPLANLAGGLSSFLNVRMETTCSQRGLPRQGDLGSDPRRVFSLADSESQFSHLQNGDISLPGWIFFIHSFIHSFSIWGDANVHLSPC